MKYTIQVLAREWAGTLRDSWRPAIDGTMNGTNMEPERASEFESLEAAQDMLPMIMECAPAKIRIRDDSGGVVFEWSNPDNQ